MWSDLLSKKMQKQNISVVELQQAIQQGIHIVDSHMIQHDDITNCYTQVLGWQ